jgi:hypothetical protein
MSEVPDALIFGVVVALRLGLPLLIPKFPLPAILACLVVDGVDQTIFQKFTSADLTGYQSYDKALDIYYLTIAYLATMRNWTNLSAFRVSRFLFFYRLVGVVIFEFSQVRAILMIFPNTFEYFFIFYEAVRARWNPRRMTTRFVIAATAFIWIFVKLPQEYWIHIAQLDTTDLLKEEVFGVSTSSTWAAAFANRPMVVVAALLAVVGLWFLLRWVARNKLPPADYRLRLAADPLPQEIDGLSERMAYRASFGRVFGLTWLEKVVIISLVSTVFAQILPGATASPLQVTLAVVVLVAANSFISLWVARRGRSVESTGLSFVALAIVNSGLVILANWLLDRGPGDIQVGNTLFFVLLLTLIVTLYDRFQPVYRVRFPEGVALSPEAAAAG